MNLQKAKLYNYRRFISEEIVFERPLTVLIGRNNSGKTTILEALAILFQIMPGPIPINRKIGNSDEVLASAEVQFIFNEKDWSKIVELVSDAYPQFNDELLLSTVMPQLVKAPITYRWTSKYAGGKYVQGQDSRTIGFSDKDILHNFSEAESTIINAALENVLSIHLGKFIGVVHIPSDRYFPGEEKFIPFNQLNELEESRRGQFIRSNLYHLRRTAPSKYKNIIGILTRVFEDITHVDNYLDENTGKIELNFTEGETMANLLEMGAGVRSLVTLLGRILSPGISLALLDEPDINLHPGLVRELLLLLREMHETTQVIISSHNETFINAVDQSNILHVKASNSYMSAVSSLEAEKDAVEIVKDLGISLENFKLSEAVAGHPIILGEGETDWEYLKEFARKQGILSKVLSLSPVYVTLGGKRLVDVKLLDKIKGAKTSFLLIRDRDEYNSTEIEKLQGSIGPDRLHFLKRREIENYLLDYNALYNLISNKLQKKSVYSQLSMSYLKSNIMNLATSFLKRKLILLKLIHNIPGLTLLSGEEVHLFIERNISKDNYDVINELSGNVLEKVAAMNKKKLEDILQLQEKEVEQRWTEEGILEICPGKDLLKLIRKWVKKEYDVEIPPYELIQHLDGLDNDISELFQKIIRLPSS